MAQQSEVMVCSNIGPKERHKRLTAGIFGMVAGVVLGVILLATGLPWYVRLLLFFPFSVAMTGFFQARAATCVALVMKGVRNMDGGEEKVEDAAIMAQLRRQAIMIQAQSGLVGGLLTLLFVIIPV